MNSGPIQVKEEKIEGIKSPTSFDSLEAVKNVVRRIIPPHIPVEEDAIKLIHECMLDFSSSISFEIINQAAIDRRGHVDGQDLHHGLLALGYDDYVEPLRKYLIKRTEHASFCTGCLKGICEVKSETEQVHIKSTTSQLESAAAAPPEVIVEKKRGGARKKKADLSNPDSTPTDNMADATATTTTTKPKQQVKRPRADWSNPEFIAEVLQSFEEAMQATNQNEFISNLSKQLHVPKRDLFQKFQEVKRSKAQQQPQPPITPAQAQPTPLLPSTINYRSFHSSSTSSSSSSSSSSSAPSSSSSSSSSPSPSSLMSPFSHPPSQPYIGAPPPSSSSSSSSLPIPTRVPSYPVESSHSPGNGYRGGGPVSRPIAIAALNPHSLISSFTSSSSSSSSASSASVAVGLAVQAPLSATTTAALSTSSTASTTTTTTTTSSSTPLSSFSSTVVTPIMPPLPLPLPSPSPSQFVATPVSAAEQSEMEIEIEIEMEEGKKDGEGEGEDMDVTSPSVSLPPPPQLL